MNSYHPEMYNLLMQWTERIREDARDEWKVNASQPSYVLNDTNRCMLWLLCELTHVSENGIPGYACHLVEFYIAEKMREYVSQGRLVLSWMEQYESEIVNNFPAIMAGAIIIATQLQSTASINTSMVSEILINQDFTVCTVENIRNFEFEIMRVHNFKLSLWSTVRLGEFLACALTVPHDTIPFTSILVNYSEFIINKITAKLRALFPGNIFGGVRVLTLHLAAACVYATFKYYKQNTETALCILSSITDAPDLYISHMTDIILHHAHADGVI